MPARNAKGRFVKSGGSRSKSRRRSGGGGTKALVIQERISVSRPRRSSAPAVYTKKRKGGHRRRHHHSRVTPAKLIGTALVLGSAAETANGPLGGTLFNLVQKLPGQKTFGGAVTAGLYAGALSYTKFGGRGWWGPLLRCAGIVGVVGAGLKIGAAGTKFQWLGGDAGQADPYMHVR